MPGIMDRISGLLATPGAQDFATGLLAQSGYTSTPTTLGQAIGGATQFAQTNQMQRMQLQAARQKMEDDKKRREAQAGIAGILANPAASIPMGIRSPTAVQDEAGRMQGLLAQANPEAFSKGLLERQFAQPQAPRMSTGMNDYIAMTGMQPGSPGFMEGFAKFQQDSDPMAQVQAGLLALQLRNEERELAEAEETSRVGRLTLERNTNNDLKSLQKLYEMNEILEPTFLATGGVMPRTRRDLMSLFSEGGKLFGIDSSDKDEIIEAFDTFSKEQENLANRVANNYGSTTNARYQGIINSIPNLGLNPGANRSVISRMMEDFLGGADDYGFEVNNRDQYESLLGIGKPPSGSPAQTSTRNVMRFDASGNLIP